MVMKMTNDKYEKIVKNNKATETRCRNAFLAFLVGGLIGLIGEGIIEILCYYFKISRSDASTYMIVILIFVASLCTALGFFDKFESVSAKSHITALAIVDFPEPFSPLIKVFPFNSISL